MLAVSYNHTAPIGAHSQSVVRVVVCAKELININVAIRSRIKCFKAYYNLIIRLVNILFLSLSESLIEDSGMFRLFKV